MHVRRSREHSRFDPTASRLSPPPPAARQLASRLIIRRRCVALLRGCMGSHTASLPDLLASTIDDHTDAAATLDVIFRAPATRVSIRIEGTPTSVVPTVHLSLGIAVASASANLVERARANRFDLVTYARAPWLHLAHDHSAAERRDDFPYRATWIRTIRTLSP